MVTEPHRILLVEDNPGDARLVQEAFDATANDTAIHTVTDGESAFEFFQTQATAEESLWPDLILLDLNLPAKSGIEVLEAIRSAERSRRIPVIVLSSSAAPKDVARSYREHANAYLTKPTDPAEYVSLASTIEQFWLETAHLPPAPT